jgi:hypothetical protein
MPTGQEGFPVSPRREGKVVMLYFEGEFSFEDEIEPESAL